MAISIVSTATGTNTISSMPSHANGDLLIMFSYRDGSTTAPSLASGWTNIADSGANSCSARIAYRWATSDSMTSGTWTNASSVILVVVRGAEAVGDSAAGGGTGTTMSFTALSSMVETDGTSWVLGFVGHRATDTTITNAPSGMMNQASVSDATDQAAMHTTNGGVSSWSTTTVSIGGTSSGWRTYTLEIVEEPFEALTRSAPGYLIGHPAHHLEFIKDGFIHKTGEPSAAKPWLVPSGRGFTAEVLEGQSVSYRITTGTDSGSLWDPLSYCGSCDSQEFYWGDKSNRSALQVLRFTGVQIPRGAKIVSAYISVWSSNLWGGSNTNSYSTFGCEQVDNASAISSYSNGNSRRSNVGTTVKWYLVNSGSTGTLQKSPNLKDLVQEIVNRAGWPDGTGGAIMFFGQTNTGANSLTGSDPSCYSSGNNGGNSNNNPLLEIVYME